MFSSHRMCNDLWGKKTKKEWEGNEREGGRDGRGGKGKRDNRESERGKWEVSFKNYKFMKIFCRGLEQENFSGMWVSDKNAIHFPRHISVQHLSSKCSQGRLLSQRGELRRHPTLRQTRTGVPPECWHWEWACGQSGTKPIIQFTTERKQRKMKEN